MPKLSIQLLFIVAELSITYCIWIIQNTANKNYQKYIAASLAIIKALNGQKNIIAFGWIYILYIIFTNSLRACVPACLRNWQEKLLNCGSWDIN